MSETKCKKAVDGVHIINKQSGVCAVCGEQVEPSFRSFRDGKKGKA